MALTEKQVSNGKLMLREVGRRARNGKWTRDDARRVARMATMCVLTESGMRVLANPEVPASMHYPHDGVGSDHDSIGMFQQRPGWGTVAERMDIAHSTSAFIDEALRLGVTRRESGVPTWLAVQRVQRSAFEDGSNYKANRTRAFAFVLRHWSYYKMVAR